MTIVFRTSSFFIIFVFTLKATTFVFSSTSSGDGAADRLNEHVARLVDEAVRFRGEFEETHERTESMSAALQILGDRAIVRTLSLARKILRATKGIHRELFNMVTPLSDAGFALSKENWQSTKAPSHGGVWDRRGLIWYALPVPKSQVA
jgi:hypothetical protein